MSRRRTWLLVLACCTGLMWGCNPTSLAAADRAATLRALSLTPAADMPARAADFTKREPDEARAIALDLIFYYWANLEYDLDPGMQYLDKVARALSSASSDASVIWAAAVLGPKEWPARPVPSEEDDLIKSLSQARQALRSAVGFSGTYPTRSIENLGTCAAVLRNLDLRLSEAIVTERIAERQLYATRRYREAEAAYERARSVFAAYELRERVARIYDDLGHLNSEAGRYYPGAYSSYKYAAQEWRALGKDDVAGKQYINAGLAMAAAGRPDSALRTMLYGLELSGKNARDAKSYGFHAQLLLQVASFCSSRANYADAQKLLDEAENAIKDSGDSLLLAAILRDQAGSFSAAGKEPMARGCLTRREAVLSRLAQRGQEASAKLADLSMSAVEQSGLLQSAETGALAAAALGRFQQAADVMDRVADIYSALRRDDDEVRALRGLASHYDALGDRRSALLARRQAAEIAMHIGKQPLAVDILREIKESALDAKDPGTALEALRESVQVVESSGDMLALADVLQSRGGLLASMGQAGDAIRDLQRSASIYTAEVGEPWSAVGVLAKLAEVQVNAGQPKDAVASLSAAVKRVEEWFAAEEINPSAEPGHADTLFNLYLQLVGLQIREGQRKDALAHLVTARQYVWFERMRSLLTASGDATAAAVLKELDATVREPAAKSAVAAEGARKIASGWQVVLSQVPQFSRFARRGHYSGPVGPVDAGEISKIRTRLPKDLAIVEYAVSDTSVYALIATSIGVTCWELPVTSDKLDSSVQALRKALGETEKKIAAGVAIPPVKSWSDPSLLPILEPLFELQEMLIQPIRVEFSRMTTLVFALPEELEGLPFHALAIERSGSMQFLIQDYAISYIRPGMLLDLVKLSLKPINAKTEPVAIFADSTGAFPGAMREATLIKSYYPKSQVYTGTVNATADRFVRAASSSCIVHIAAHHRPDPNPSKFSIVLSGKPGGPGTVRLSDIMRISNPNLRLAVLSACDTIGAADAESGGTAYTAEVLGLAGFPSVVGGLWKISDTASVEIMRNFYRYLASTGRKAEALRLAQVFMIKSNDGKFANPFYWATFALYGDPR